MTYDPTQGGTPQIARSTSRLAHNITGSVIAQALPVKVTSTGMATLNPSVEADIDAFLGVTSATVANGGFGEIITAGIIQNVSLDFSVGDVVFISKSGGLTNVKPQAGANGWVAGDFCVRIGVIVQNSNPSFTDLLVAISQMGQL